MSSLCVWLFCWRKHHTTGKHEVTTQVRYTSISLPAHRPLNPPTQPQCTRTMPTIPTAHRHLALQYIMLGQVMSTCVFVLLGLHLGLEVG
eukprot:14296638-Alexandrium_andersonii.AAC.1